MISTQYEDYFAAAHRYKDRFKMINRLDATFFQIMSRAVHILKIKYKQKTGY